MSLRILCIGGPLLVSALNRLGHSTFTVHPGTDADLPTPHPYTVRQLSARLEARGFIPDALFYCDDGNMAGGVDLRLTGNGHPASKNQLVGLAPRAMASSGNGLVESHAVLIFRFWRRLIAQNGCIAFSGTLRGPAL